MTASIKSSRSNRKKPRVRSNQYYAFQKRSWFLQYFQFCSRIDLPLIKKSSILTNQVNYFKNFFASRLQERLLIIDDYEKDILNQLNNKLAEFETYIANNIPDSFGSIQNRLQSQLSNLQQELEYNQQSQHATNLPVMSITDFNLSGTEKIKLQLYCLSIGGLIATDKQHNLADLLKSIMDDLNSNTVELNNNHKQHLLRQVYDCLNKFSSAVTVNPTNENIILAKDIFNFQLTGFRRQIDNEKLPACSAPYPSPDSSPKIFTIKYNSKEYEDLLSVSSSPSSPNSLGSRKRSMSC
jgi:gas vesicle protein